MINEYQTSDLNIACYLLSKGLIFKTLKDNWNRQRVIFVLQVPDELNLEELLKSWENSIESAAIRKFAHYSKVMRGELKRYFEKWE